MLAEGSIIRVHFCDRDHYPGFTNEIKHELYDHSFEVKSSKGKLGIDWNVSRRPYICGGDLFNPFNTFSYTVVFEDLNTGKLYHYNNVLDCIEELFG